MMGYDRPCSCIEVINQREARLRSFRDWKFKVV